MGLEQHVPTVATNGTASYVCMGCGAQTDAVVLVCLSCQRWMEHVDRLTRERDEARADNERLRALLREVAQGEPLGGTLADYIDVQLPTRVWLSVKAALEGR